LQRLERARLARPQADDDKSVTFAIEARTQRRARAALAPQALRTQPRAAWQGFPLRRHEIGWDDDQQHVAPGERIGAQRVRSVRDARLRLLGNQAGSHLLP
jgi:hypothetical protein